MFGLNFVQQGFLFAGLAAAVPVLIHLLLRQKARRVDIGSLRFVRHVVREHNRMRRLRQWLLLAARVAALLLLAMLFARPFLDRSSLEASQRAVVLLLDQSASMQLHEGRGATVFSRARDELKRELREIHENTLVTLAAFDGQTVRKLTVDQIDSAEPGFGGTDFEQAISWARDTLQQSGRPEKRIVLITDLQQTGVRAAASESWPADVQLEVVDVGQAFTNNVSLEKVEVISTEIRPQLPPTVSVEVRNGSPLSIPEFPVRLVADNGRRSVSLEKTVELTGAERKPLSFELEGLEPGVYRGHVQLECDDSIAFDDRRYFAFEARLPDRLLIVDGQEGNSVFASETYFLETALQLGAERPFKGIPTFETERIVWENGEGFPDLSGFRVIILANVGRFSETDIRRLRSFVNNGGSVLFFAGDQFDGRVAEPLHEAGVLPAKFDQIASNGDFRLARWKTEHPIFAPFEDPQYGDLRRIKFRRIARLAPAPGAEVIARSLDEDPLLVELAVGPGRVLCVATTADRAWSDWPQNRLYVPFMRQIMAYLTGQHLRAQRIVSEDAGSSEDRQPGIKQRDDVLVVRNVDSYESELARISLEDFREAMNLPELTGANPLTPAEAAALAPPPGTQRANEIWPYFAWMLLIVLVLETFLAGRVHG